MTDTNIVDSLTTLIEEFARSGVATLHVRSEAFEVLLSNEPGAGMVRAAAAPATPSTTLAERASRRSTAASAPPVHAIVAASSEDALPPGAVVVRAPNLGTFYRAPKPGADFYVEVGGKVEIDQEICLIEVMKLFTAVRAEDAGRVHAVLAEDGSMVEAGQALFVLVKD